MRIELIIEILDKALTEELGVVVGCENQHYTVLEFQRAKSNLSKYSELMVCAGSNPKEILIVQKTVELDDAREPTDESQ